MARLGDFLSSQGRLILDNDRIAWVYIAALVVIPYADWLSAAVVALITMRKGWIEGLPGLMIAIVVKLLFSLYFISFSGSMINAFIAFLPCYITASVLHATANWRIASLILLMQILIVVAAIHWLAPDLISNQYLYFLNRIKEFERESADTSLTTMLSNKEGINQVVLSNYLLGIQALSVALSAVASLSLARSVQSKIFYPGGFRQEMIGFRASGFALIFLILGVVGAYQHNPLAISCIPLLVGYYVFAGLSLSFNILSKGKKGIGLLLLLILLLIFLPFVMLPVYVLLGALDSLFNFRLHLLEKTDEKEKKG